MTCDAKRRMREAYRAFMEEHVYPAEPALAREDEAADELVGGLRGGGKAEGGVAPQPAAEAGGAGFAIVMAVTAPEAEPHRRLSQILVPADTPGITIEPVSVSGHRGHGWSTHCEVWFRGVRVPAENVLGERGDGFRIAQKRLGP